MSRAWLTLSKSREDIGHRGHEQSVRGIWSIGTCNRSQSVALAATRYDPREWLPGHAGR